MSGLVGTQICWFSHAKAQIKMGIPLGILSSISFELNDNISTHLCAGTKTLSDDTPTYGLRREKIGLEV